MSASKTTILGLLICLIGLYMMSDVWLNSPIIVIGAYGFPIGAIVTLVGLIKQK